MDQKPKLRHIWITTALVFVPGGMALFFWLYGPAWAAYLMLGIAGSMAFGWFLTLISWISVFLDERYQRRVYAHNLTPFAFAVQQVARLTPEQAKLIPALSYDLTVATTVSNDGQIGFSLLTPNGAVPYEWVAGFLQASGVTTLNPVRNYRDRSTELQFAVALTDWLVANRYAVPASGNQPAMWMSADSRPLLESRLRLWELLAYAHHNGANG